MKYHLTARIGLAAHWLSEVSLRVVDWANRVLATPKPLAPEPAPEESPPVDQQAENLRRIGDAQAILSEYNTRIVPHHTLLYASAGINEDGVRFLRENVWIVSERGAVPVIVTHQVGDSCQIVGSHIS